MIATSKTLAGVTTWDELSAILYLEGIDTARLSEADRAVAMSIWGGDRIGGQDDVAALTEILRTFGESHARRLTAFCPICGDETLYVTCDASAYYKLLTVQLGPAGAWTRTESEQLKPPAVHDPDIWRCENCDFNVEHEDDLMRFASRGGQVEGLVTIDQGIRVELIGPAARAPRQRWIATISYYHPDAPAGWIDVVGGGTNRVTLPVIGSDGPLRREIVMRSLAAEIEGALRHRGQPGPTLEQLNENGQMDIGEALASIELGIAANSKFRHG